jgi:hypothetical protein
VVRLRLHREDIHTAGLAMYVLRWKRGQRVRLHPAEYREARLAISRTLRELAERRTPGLSENERNTLENRFFVVSRYCAALSEMATQGASPRTVRSKLVLLKAFVADAFASVAKWVLSFLLKYQTNRGQARKVEVVFAAYLPSLADYASHLLEILEPKLDTAWAIYANKRVREQRRLKRRLDSLGRTAWMTAAEVHLRDSVKAFGRIGWLSRQHSEYPFDRAYVLATSFLLLTELEGEKRRAEALRSTGCRILVTQDDCDYLAAYRNRCLIESGVVVVGLMHGVGVYGPNFEYSHYCVWGGYFRDSLVALFQTPARILRVTGRARANPAPTLWANGSRGHGVTLLLQPIVPRNPRKHIVELVEGALEAVADTPSKVRIRLHPFQEWSVAAKMRQIVREYRDKAELVDPRDPVETLMAGSAICVTNFSTAGLEAIALGTATMFYCKAPGALVPMARYVPTCVVNRYEDYVAALRRLVTDQGAWEKLRSEEAGAISHFFADNPEERYLSLAGVILANGSQAE